MNKFDTWTKAHFYKPYIHGPKRSTHASPVPRASPTLAFRVDYVVAYVMSAFTVENTLQPSQAEQWRAPTPSGILWNFAQLLRSLISTVTR